MNLCLHKADFVVKCIWSFFATSQGKPPRDGIRDTMKRLTARTSLQRVTRTFIWSAQEEKYMSYAKATCQSTKRR